MTVMAALTTCQARGVSLEIVNGRLAAKGTPEAIDSCRTMLKQHKADLIAHLLSDAAQRPDWRALLLSECIEQDGMTHEEAAHVVAIAVEPMAPAKWLGLIADLDAAITVYCTVHKLSDDTRNRILSVRRAQPAGTIRADLAWFQEHSRVEAPCMS